MKNHHGFAWLPLVVALLASFAHGQTERTPIVPEEPLSLIVELVDGSIIKGTTSLREIPFVTEFARIKIPLAKVDHVKRNRDPESFRIRLINGDLLQGTVAMEAIPLQTLIGRLELRIRDVGQIRTRIGGSPITDGLILWLDVRDFDGTKWPDRSSQSGDAEIRHVGKADDRSAFFDGKESLIQIPRKHRLQQFTVCIWGRKTDAFSAFEESIISCGVDGDFFIDHGGASTNDAEWRGVLFTGTGVFQHNFTAQRFTSRWVMFAMTYDGQTLKYYQDGAPCGQVPATGPPHMTGKYYQLGLRNDGLPHYKGYLGDVLIYRRALSAEEILTSFEAGASRFLEP